MCKLNKYIKTIEDKNLFAFQGLINKDGSDILDYLSNVFCEKDYCDSLYLLIVSNLWNVKANTLKQYKDINDYILKNISKFSEKAKSMPIEQIADFPSLYNEMENKKLLKRRRVYHINEKVINHILINDFKNELNIEECFYDIVLNTVSTFKTDRRSNSGLIYTKSYNHPCYYVYVVTLEKIYIRRLNIKYDILENKNSYRSFDIEKVKFISFVGPRQMKLLDRNMFITFENFEDFVILRSKSDDSRRFKKVLTILLDSYNIRIKELSTKSTLENVI